MCRKADDSLDTYSEDTPDSGVIDTVNEDVSDNDSLDTYSENTPDNGVIDTANENVSDNDGLDTYSEDAPENVSTDTADEDMLKSDSMGGTNESMSGDRPTEMAHTSKQGVEQPSSDVSRLDRGLEEGGEAAGGTKRNEGKSLRNPEKYMENPTDATGNGSTGQNSGLSDNMDDVQGETLEGNKNNPIGGKLKDAAGLEKNIGEDLNHAGSGLKGTTMGQEENSDPIEAGPEIDDKIMGAPQDIVRDSLGENGKNSSQNMADASDMPYDGPINNLQDGSPGTSTNSGTDLGGENNFQPNNMTGDSAVRENTPNGNISKSQIPVENAGKIGAPLTGDDALTENPSGLGKLPGMDYMGGNKDRANIGPDIENLWRKKESKKKKGKLNLREILLKICNAIATSLALLRSLIPLQKLRSIPMYTNGAANLCRAAGNVSPYYSGRTQRKNPYKSIIGTGRLPDNKVNIKETIPKNQNELGTRADGILNPIKSIAKDIVAFGIDGIVPKSPQSLKRKLKSAFDIGNQVAALSKMRCDYLKEKYGKDFNINNLKGPDKLVYSFDKISNAMKKYNKELKKYQSGESEEKPTAPKGIKALNLIGHTLDQFQNILDTTDINGLFTTGKDYLEKGKKSINDLVSMAQQTSPVDLSLKMIRIGHGEQQ